MRILVRQTQNQIIAPFPGLSTHQFLIVSSPTVQFLITYLIKNWMVRRPENEAKSD